MTASVLLNPYRITPPAPVPATIKAGSFRSRTSAGTDSVTGLGFQPKAIVFGICRRGFSNTTMGSDIRTAYAITDGTTLRSIGACDDDNLGTSATARAWTSTIQVVNNNATATAAASITFNSDGF